MSLPLFVSSRAIRHAEVDGGRIILEPPQRILPRIGPSWRRDVVDPHG